MRVPHEKQPFLSEAQKALLSAVLDLIVPPAADIPGAGELGVGEHVEGVAGLEARTRRLLTEGLRATDIVGSVAASGRFEDLPEPDQVAVLNQVESERPEFFRMLVQLGYAGYYTNPRLLGAKGLSTSPPQPGGYKMTPFDESLLEGVRRRGKVYRDA